MRWSSEMPIPTKRRKPGLTDRERLFVEAYTLNGGNATKAYQACMAPVPVKDSTAAASGWRMFRNVKVAAAIEKRRAERFKALAMEGDEALALIALRARADGAQAFDDAGRLLPFHKWPEALRLACRVRIDKDRIEVHLPDGLKAAELMAIATGKLKTNVLQLTFDHEGHLAGTDTPPALPKENPDGE
jgi:phage terminase small subunit